MAGQFEGKTAIVTGAAGGIGRASAIAFAREGAGVVVADLNIEGCEETVGMITAAGGTAVAIKTDVSKSSDVQAMVKKAVDEFGGLHFAHNNAGIEGAVGMTADYDENEWDRVLTINLKSTFLCMKYEIPEMIKADGGAIVNTASIAGLVGYMTMPAYSASKHGMLGLTKTAALEYATKGVRVNAICPGGVQTPMVDRMRATQKKEEFEALIRAMHPMGRIGQPEEIADVAVFLCSDKASFITGQALAADGGFVAQ
jgi:NAD(P)-dependent dehydrogenase (short-subunit alcohol dehydrogenase family)